jgi:hypothetical protein
MSELSTLNLLSAVTKSPFKLHVEESQQENKSLIAASNTTLSRKKSIHLQHKIEIFNKINTSSNPKLNQKCGNNSKLSEKLEETKHVSDKTDVVVSDEKHNSGNPVVSPMLEILRNYDLKSKQERIIFNSNVKSKFSTTEKNVSSKEMQYGLLNSPPVLKSEGIISGGTGSVADKLKMYNKSSEIKLSMNTLPIGPEPIKEEVSKVPFADMLKKFQNGIPDKLNTFNPINCESKVIYSIIRSPFLFWNQQKMLNRQIPLV